MLVLGAFSMPILFISGFSQAAYKYFNIFGPWTADVQGPLLNLCAMRVIMTASAARPVKTRSLLPKPGSAPIPGRRPHPTESWFFEPTNLTLTRPGSRAACRSAAVLGRSNVNSPANIGW